MCNFIKNWLYIRVLFLQDGYWPNCLNDYEVQQSSAAVYAKIGTLHLRSMQCTFKPVGPNLIDAKKY